VPDTATSVRTDVVDPAATSRPLPHRLLRAGLEGRHSAWTAPLLLWAASRVVSTLLLSAVLAVGALTGHEPGGHGGAHGLLAFSGSWDGWWYRRVETGGYPRVLPHDAHGHVLPNAWAFLPVFPALVHGLMAVTGWSFWSAGVAVSLVVGAAGTVVLHRLLTTLAGPQRARRATVVVLVGPLAFLLQVPYAEGLFLLLSSGALLALVTRRYALVGALGVVAAFTRPGALALAVAVAVHLVTLEVRARRADPATPWRRRVSWRVRSALVAVGLTIAAAGLAWPVIAAAVTGQSGAYVDTEVAWWVGLVGRVHFVPLTPWFLLAGRWLGGVGIVLVVAVVATAVWILTRRSVRALGPEVVGFVAAYGLYLFAVFLPQQSLPRLLLPTVPVLGSDLFVRTRRRTVGLVVTGISLQAVAIVLLWYVGFP
jgi:hypothetical protein